MPSTKLQDFREQYPQYNDWTDEELAAALHEKYYSTVPLEEFRGSVGVDPPPEPPAEPTTWERIKQTFSSDDDKPANILKDDPPLVDEFEDPPEPDLFNRFNYGPYDEAGMLSSHGQQRLARIREERNRETYDATGDGPLYRDVFFAGYDEYMANRADSAAFAAIDEYQAAPGAARGGYDQDLRGGLGTSVTNYNRMFRARRADAWRNEPDKYPEFQDDAMAEEAEIADSRETAINALQRAIDASAERRHRAEQIAFSGTTQEMLESEGFDQAAAEFFDDPANIMVEISLRSLPNMAESIPLAALGSLAGPAGFAVGLGTGSGMVEYRASHSEYLRNHGVDMTNARSMMNAAEDLELMRAAHEYALKRSAIIGTVDAVTGGVATKPLAPFVKNAVGRELTNIALQTGVQAIGGASGEFGAIAATEGVDVAMESGGEVLAEAIGELSTAPIEVGTAAVTGLRAQNAKNKLAQIEADTAEMLGWNDVPESDPAQDQQDADDLDVPRETPEPETPTEPQAPEIPTDERDQAEIETDEFLGEKKKADEAARPKAGDDFSFEIEGETWEVGIGSTNANGVTVVTVYNPATDTETVVDMRQDETPQQMAELVRKMYAEPLEGEVIESDAIGRFHEIQDMIDELRADPDFEINNLQEDVDAFIAQQEELRADIEAEGVNFDTLGRGGDEAQGIEFDQEEARTIEGETVAPTPPLPPPTTRATAPFDPRMKRRDFRAGLEAMANELVKGGGVTYTWDEHDRITGRTPSINPEWFQNIAANPDTKMSVKQMQNAVNKAVAGKKLGVRQVRVVQAMLDEITGMRTDPAEVDYAKQMLQEARIRRQASREATTAPIPGNADNQGSLFQEDEYDTEMGADSRIIFEMFTEAEEVGITEDELERLAIQYDDNQELMNELERRINEQRRQAGPETAAPQPSEPAPTDQAPTGRIEPGKPARPEKRKKLTKIQQSIYDQLTPGETVAWDEIKGLKAAASGNLSTSGQKLTDGGTLKVSTLQQLIDKGYVESLTPDAILQDSKYRVLEEVEARARYYDDRQLEMYLDEPPVPSQANAPDLAGAKSRAVDAVQEIAAVGTNMARKYYNEFAAKQRISLVGETIENPADLALLAQVYRDPRFETLRMIFVDQDSKVVSQLGLTGRMPASAVALVGEDMQLFLNEMALRARASGAVGYYMLHNHPSGQSMPSNADERLTQKYASDLAKGPYAMQFRGHVVIDTNNWSSIDANGVSFRHEDLTLKGVDFLRKGGATGKTITRASEVVDLWGGRPLDDVNDIVLILASQRSEVQQVAHWNADQISNDRKVTQRRLQKIALQEGGGRLFVIGRNKKAMIKLGDLVVDAIVLNKDGGFESLARQGLVGGGTLMDQWRDTRISPDTTDEFAYFRTWALRERIATGVREGRGRVRETGDLFGKDQAAQDIADEIRRRDKRRNSGQESVETGDPTDLFSEATRQRDIEDQVESRRGKYTPEELDRQERLQNMSTEELVDAVYTDPLTGAGNLKAYQEEAKLLPIKAVVDADSLKWINDNMGLEAGDAMLVAIAEALDQEGVEVYRIGGDEFIVGGDTVSEVEAALTLAEGILANQVVESPKGTSQGIRITYALGKTKAKADGRMKAEKAAKEARGERAARGEKPPNTTLSVKANQTIDMEPGTNYVPMIGKRGRLPINANNNLVLGNGRIVRIPKKPVRREHILAIMRRYFGNRIYEGRIKGQMRLGFYRPGQGELRLRHHNDIEVAAHEIAHYLDDRYPWIRRLYLEHSEEMKGVSYDAEKVYEGYAEFMRLYFTQETFAMERAPSFYDAWRAELAKHGQLNGMVEDLQELMHAWTMQGARARGASKVGSTAPSAWERFLSIPTWWDNVLQKTLDGLRRVKQIEADLGGMDTAYMKLRLAVGGANSMLEATFLWGTPGKREDGQGYEFTGDGLKTVFGDFWGDHDFGMYMLARRAQEMELEGKSSGFRPDEIAAWMEYAEENPQAEAIFDAWLGFSDRMLDFAVQTGILSEEAKAKFAEAWSNYVPMHRVVESRLTGKPVQSGGNPFMRLKGSERNVNVVWENIMNQTGLVIRAGLVNDAKRTLFRKLAKSEPLGAGDLNQAAGVYAAPIGTDNRPVSITGNQVLQASVEAMGWTMAQYRMAKEGFIQGEDDLLIVDMIERMENNLGDFVTLFETNVAPTGNVDSYQDGDQRRYFEIMDPLLWDTLKFIGPKGTNMVLQILGGFTAALRRGVVSLPVFQSKNFVRDTLNAWMLSSSVKVPAARAVRMLTERMAKDPLYQEMVLNGGGFASRSQGLEVQRKMIIDPAEFLHRYDRAMARFENANRLAEYEAARAQGVSPRRAALLSREISTDFAMRGSAEIARILAISVPFLNARAQGNYRVARQFNTGQMARSYAIRGLAIASATLALYALNKDDERYEELPEDIKDLYWVFFYGSGEDDYFLLPKPFESGMIWGTIPERTFELVEEEDGKEFADAMLWMFLQTFNMDMTPQAFQPWIDLEKNKTFTGAPIIPFGLENVEPSEQFSYYTSETAKEAGQLFGVSPMKLEYVMRGYLGTMGTYALGISDAMINTATGPWTDPVTGEVFEAGQYGDVPTRGEGWKENILVRGMVDWAVNEGPPRRSKYVTDLYDMVRESEQIMNTLNRKLDRQAEDTEAYLNDPMNQFMIAANPTLENARKELSEIRQAMEAIRIDRRMTGDEKRVELWNFTRLRNDMAREVVQAVRDAEDQAAQEALDQAQLERASIDQRLAATHGDGPEVAAVAQ